jgi:predicted metal-dependent hydrolase
VAAVVEKKHYWIWGKLRDPQKFAQPRPAKEFVPGEMFLFLGQSFGLRMVAECRGEVRFDGTRFELSRMDRREARELFAAWYLGRARAELTPRVAVMARAIGIDFKRIVVRDMKYRWGSCSPGRTLTFNWRIVQAPMIVVDYLVAHELAHLLEPNHAPKFWNIVAVHAPAWAKARAWLRRYGARLEW